MNTPVCVVFFLPGVVVVILNSTGQVQVLCHLPNVPKFLYWTHCDDEGEIAPFGSKSYLTEADMLAAGHGSRAMSPFAASPPSSKHPLQRIMDDSGHGNIAVKRRRKSSVRRLPIPKSFRKEGWLKKQSFAPSTSVYLRALSHSFTGRHMRVWRQRYVVLYEWGELCSYKHVVNPSDLAVES